jgi:hypothetical protein
VHFSNISVPLFKPASHVLSISRMPSDVPCTLLDSNNAEPSSRNCEFGGICNHQLLPHSFCKCVDHCSIFQCSSCAVLKLNNIQAQPCITFLSLYQSISMKPTKESYLYTKIFLFAHKDMHLFLQPLPQPLPHSLLTSVFFTSEILPEGEFFLPLAYFWRNLDPKKTFLSPKIHPF